MPLTWPSSLEPHLSAAVCPVRTQSPLGPGREAQGKPDQNGTRLGRSTWPGPRSCRSPGGKGRSCPGEAVADSTLTWMPALGEAPEEGKDPPHRDCCKPQPGFSITFPCPTQEPAGPAGARSPPPDQETGARAELTSTGHLPRNAEGGHSSRLGVIRPDQKVLSGPRHSPRTCPHPGRPSRRHLRGRSEPEVQVQGGASSQRRECH